MNVQLSGHRVLGLSAGVGSEMIGAMLAGWEQVTGVELTEEYTPIAEARIKHWSNHPMQKEMEI